MKKFYWLLLTMFSISAHAEFDSKEVTQLEEKIKSNIVAMNNEDLDAYLNDIHPESPAYPGTAKVLQSLFAVYDLKTTHISMKPLMIDDEYFIVRGRQKSEMLSGDMPYQDNIADAIHIYKKHDGEWLFWSSMVLDLKPIR